MGASNAVTFRDLTNPRAAPPATILDVAALAGVSRTTVSRVLNHPQTVPTETLDRVQQAVTSLQFKPNTRARSMRTGRSETIALLVGDVSQPFQSALAKSVAQAAEAQGLSLLLCDLDHNNERLMAFLRQLPHKGVDGILIATGDDFSPQVTDIIAQTRRAGTPVVVSGRLPSDEPFGVGVDFAAIAQAATNELLQHGSKRPLLLIGTAQSYVGMKWAVGYRAAVREAGLESIVLEGQYSEQASTALVYQQLSAAQPADGVVAGTVPLALSSIQAAYQARRRVPEDLAIISCEEVGLAELVTPTISSVAVAAESHGDALVQGLCRVISGGEPIAVTLPFQTRARNSTRESTGR